MRRQKLRRGEILIKAAVLVGMAAVICLAISMDDTLCAQTASTLTGGTPPPLPRRQRKQSACMFTPLRNKTKPSRRRTRASAIPLRNNKRAGIQLRPRHRLKPGTLQRGAVKGAAGEAAFGADCWRCGRGRCHWCDSWRCKGPSTTKKSAKAGRATGEADRPDSTIAATRWVSPVDGCLPRSQGIYG